MIPLLLLFAAPSALAQTMRAAPEQDALTQGTLTQGTLTQRARPSLPVPPATLQQARDQINGNFESLIRPGDWAGGQIQSLWSDARPGAGYYRTAWCAACVYRMVTREFMVSSIILPEGSKIHSFDVGDSASFQVKQRADNILALLPAKFGSDTSLLVYTQAGVVYPFYIRAEGVNSDNIPDLVLKITGGALADRDLIPFAATHGGVPANCGDPVPSNCDLKPLPADKDVIKKRPLPEDKDLQAPLPAPDKDFVIDVPFNLDKLHGWGRYELWGQGNLAEKAWRPLSIFRDDIFTYIKFGAHWNPLEAPSAFVVMDDIDENVNTRIEGRTYIIESTHDLITLKSGQSYLCIKYLGEED